MTLSQLGRRIDEEQRRISYHVASLQMEIDAVDERIQDLISKASFDNDVYKKIRHLQLVRDIMREQLQEMYEILREWR